ncbi:PAS domain S-box protein [Rhodohalobacter sp. SW132]|uniref:sensor histidine kinase n=1 Tax=Rhodohalobacter sp. SW132 TaxID=2293433 RepID=UPI000E233F04|nr:ATP-binding protein [Rhodohalobacter sp. SW132]REL37869.1 PAS domain S-box protein [Rhodohalobacter sp. SW132]
MKGRKMITDQLLDNAPCGYLQIDRGGAILRINKTLRRWLGYDGDEEIEARSIEDLLKTGSKIYCHTHVLPLLNMQGELSEINLTMKGRNSVTFPALINAKKDAADPGKIHTFSVFVVDITQRKMYESELLKERKKAENATVRLKQVNSDLEQFAYTASHDLQGPLRTISGMIELLEKKKIIEPGSEGYKLFSLIKRNSNQMKMMVRDLLEYSKVNDSQPDYSSVSIGDVCRQSINLLKDDVKNNGAVFHISEMPVISGSEPQLIRLFQNLFENAIKYRSEETPVIAVTQNTTHDYYYIRVRDNGIGFEKENTAKIFSFMKRLHTDEDIPGTGIGLTSCKRIMKHHGGSISAESKPGEGSVFKLQFTKN